MKKRSGEALAALSRKTGPMRHRLEPRGGSQREDWEEDDSAYAVEPEAANQCMGCQAGWLLVDHSHQVVGGYQGEIVRCTKDRYQ